MRSPSDPVEADDRWWMLVVSASFSVALGAGTITIPLVALNAGYSPAMIGFLAAIAAGVQFTARLALPPLLGRFPDRALILGSSLLMALAFGLLAASTALPVFVAAQVCQGGARAAFWTSAQAHVVRGARHPVRRLVDLTLAGNAGTLSGPLIAGTLASIALPLALIAGIVGGLLSAIASVGLRRLPPFDRRAAIGSLALLRRDGVSLAAWASTVSGGWWSMVGSYVPVLLVGAGLGPQAIGASVTVSEGAGSLALVALRRVAPSRVRRLVTIDGFVMAAVLVGLAVTPPIVAVYLALLALGGAASGSVTALAPAMASLAAGAEEQGDALALSGAFRAGFLFVSPAAVGALLAVAPLGSALVVLGMGLGLPGLVLARPSGGAASPRSAPRSPQDGPSR